MAWFNFIKNNRRKTLIEKGVNAEIVRFLAESDPALFHKIVSMIDSGAENKQLPLHENSADSVTSEMKDVSEVNRIKVEDSEIPEKPKVEEEPVKVSGKQVNVNFGFKNGNSDESSLPNNTHTQPKVKNTIKVEIPDIDGKSQEVYVWDEQEEEEFENTEHELLKKVTTTVHSPIDNTRIVVIGAKGNESPEVLAYYETLKAFGKMLIDESEVTVLRKYDAFYFVGGDNEPMSDAQIKIANNAKNLYVVYFDGKITKEIPFKREYIILVPFKAVEKYDSLVSRVDFLMDYSNIEIVNKDKVKGVSYINTLSLLNNNNQLLRTKTIRNSKLQINALTDYVYVNNYHENIAFPLNKTSKNLDITVYGQSDPEIVAPVVTFRKAIDYYSAPVYIEKYDKILHFVSSEMCNLQYADPALMTYAESAIPMAIVSPNSKNREEYLKLISPENAESILTKEELFERFGNGVVQLKTILGYN